MLRRLARLGAQAVLPALVLLGAWLVMSALLEGPERDVSMRRERAETVYSVTASDIVLGDNRASLRGFGEVVAADSAELRVASPGEVIDVHDRLQVGQTVEAGTALVTIDPFAYEGALRDAKAQLAEARAREAEAAARIAMEESDLARQEEQLVFAQTDLDRADRLSSTGSITEQAVDNRRLLVSQRQQALDQSRHTLEAERARRDQQRAAVERLEWSVEKAERALRDTVLRAPFRGIVRAEEAAIGRLLQANDVAVSLIKADELDVRFVLSDQRYGRLLSNAGLFGTPVEVIWRIGDTPITYTATIYRAGADIDGTRGGVDVFAHLSLDGRPAPRPGAFVEVRVPGIVHRGTARVPNSAIYDGLVFVIGPDDRLVSRPVTVLALDGSEAIVRGALSDGDPVVTTRLSEAGDGIKVRRVNPAADEGTEEEAAVAARERAADLAAADAAEAAPEQSADPAEATADEPRPSRSRRHRGDGASAERS